MRTRYHTYTNVHIQRVTDSVGLVATLVSSSHPLYTSIRLKPRLRPTSFVVWNCLMRGLGHARREWISRVRRGDLIANCGHVLNYCAGSVRHYSRHRNTCNSTAIRFFPRLWNRDCALLPASALRNSGRTTPATGTRTPFVFQTNYLIYDKNPRNNT